MRKILIFLLSFSFFSPLLAQGNSIPKSSKVQALEELPDILPDSIKYRFPLFNGLSVTVNIFDPVMEAVKLKHASYEATLTANLHHRFFPQISVGMGHSKDEDDYGLRFKTHLSPFMKVGMLYNFKYNDYRPQNFYYALLRYGMSKFKADIENISFTDGYWADYEKDCVRDIEYTCHWIEVGGGIQVHLMKHLALGWEVTLRPMITSGDNYYGRPDFTPGYGRSRFAFAFNIIYDIF